MEVIYPFFIFIFEGFIRLAGIFNPKAKEMIVGRKLQKKLIHQLHRKTNKRIWIHAASLGEYEMSIPLIEEIKKREPNAEFIISFFSPSGFKNAKLLENCIKFYLPFDSKNNATKWLNDIDPDLAIFVKYEFWPNFLQACHDKNIPLWFWNFLLRENHFILKNWAFFWQNKLQNCTGFFCQDAKTLELSQKINLPNAKILGDIRYLRTKNIQENLLDIPQKLKDFTRNKVVLILGSSWEPEEDAALIYLLKNSISDSQRIIIAPHNISDNHIQEILQKFKKFGIQQLSKFNENTETKIIIIDSIGLLSRLYSISNIAVIGGGFGNGLHNIIEAAAAGVPVIFGPNTHKFPEAKEFCTAGIGFQVNSIEEMANLIKIHFNKSETDFEFAHSQTKAYFEGKIPQISGAISELLNLGS